MSNNNSLNDSMQSFNTSTSTPSNSNKLNKKPRYAFNQDDERFALIMWKNNKYNTISMNDVEKYDKYEIDQELKCRFNGHKHPGIIKFIGTEEECEDKLIQICDYMQNESLKKTISKKPTGQKLAASINENQEMCKQQLNEAENKELKTKLQSKEFEYEKLIEQNENLTSQLKTEQLKYEKLLSEFNQFKESVNSSKLLSIGLCIVNGLAKPSDLANLNVLNDDQVDLDSDKVVLSSKLPAFTIPIRLKTSLVSMSKEKNYITGKLATTMSIYRTLVKNIFTESELANSNSDILKENYPILSACKDFMNTLRDDFSSGIESTVLREECAHARQNGWKQDPNRRYNINGKILTKQTEKRANKRVRSASTESNQSSTSSSANASSSNASSSNASSSNASSANASSANASSANASSSITSSSSAPTSSALSSSTSGVLIPHYQQQYISPQFNQIPSNQYQYNGSYMNQFISNQFQPNQYNHMIHNQLNQQQYLQQPVFATAQNCESQFNSAQTNHSSNTKILMTGIDDDDETTDFPV